MKIRTPSLIVLALASAATAQITTRVSVASEATNLVPDDANGFRDVFVRDRRTGVTRRVSVDSIGGDADGHSEGATLSADGRFVAFHSDATDLVPGDTNAALDVFVRDLTTGTTTRVSVSSLGEQGNDDSALPSLSADGRFVAFHGPASNLVPDDTLPLPVSDVFVHDRLTGVTVRASVDSAGAQAEGYSALGSISADGSRVSFSSNAPNLVPGDTNSANDVFVRDLAKGTTVRVSVSSTGAQSILHAGTSRISGDGRIVLFESYTWNLVPEETNGMPDCFVHDLETGITARVSLTSAGTQVRQPSHCRDLSHDGRFVVFDSSGGVVPEDMNFELDVFVRDRLLGTTTRVSIGSSGQEGLGDSFSSAISADGRHVAFWSFAPNLVRMDTNGVPDVFVSGVDQGIRD